MQNNKRSINPRTLMHHAHSGNLDRPRVGDISTLTVKAYLALTRNQKLRYRFYRHPLVPMDFGPACLFLIDNRLPIDFMKGDWMPWLSTMTTNATILVVLHHAYHLADVFLFTICPKG